MPQEEIFIFHCGELTATIYNLINKEIQKHKHMYLVIRRKKLNQPHRNKVRITERDPGEGQKNYLETLAVRERINTGESY